MIYALLIWLSLSALASGINAVTADEPAKRAGFLVNAATNAVFVAYVWGRM